MTVQTVRESPDKLGRLKVGDTVYVSANRNCTVTWNGDTTGQNPYGRCVDEVNRIEDLAGLYPTIKRKGRIFKYKVLSLYADSNAG